MFSYNTLSDLITGELVTPLSKTADGKILCLNGDGTQSEYTFEDFDFDRLSEERTIEEEIDDSENDGHEEEVETKEVETEIVEEIDDSENDGHEDLEEEIKKELEETIYKEGFCENPKAIKSLGLKKGICYLDIV